MVRFRCCCQYFQTRSTATVKGKVIAQYSQKSGEITSFSPGKSNLNMFIPKRLCYLLVWGSCAKFSGQHTQTYVGGRKKAVKKAIVNMEELSYCAAFTTSRLLRLSICATIVLS